mmetsp:Transcript_42712/g.68658  ORF Transcript_42712/g.68658 Transcript_42712/m.68658 type:complete len:529 (-) Transcript_42712:441-2027(-)|eukprot:CAMPEP_0203746530 /NCGR_PEP_ID=MMETSP0098-20131031/1947_1 /ASSEMBLY_ACC=CAM_ASM_000208 /TAXON_ID=96639 /ORGANISM=" , Strain NY0313808BC1" /LENGTH=528 /DNA_ID=CAMNT_0050634661 /DNA_START=141 /DNA_END=1727 /DNA_ORIENTATION=-
MTMKKNFKVATRRMKQQTLQTLGVAECAKDEAFEEEYKDYKKTCNAIKSLRKTMTRHLEAVQKMQASASTLSVELAAFHQHTDFAKPTVAFGHAHAETERIQLASVERLYEEEVKAATELLLWQVPEVEDKVRHRKKLVLDYNAQLRKYEHACGRTAQVEYSDMEKGSKKSLKNALYRRKSESEIAEEIANRKIKLEEAELAVDKCTKWILQQFQEIAEKRRTGTILEGPMSALLACQLHLSSHTSQRLEVVKPSFQSVESFATTLARYDKEPPKTHTLDVEGVAHITNSATKRKTVTEDTHVFGVPLEASSSIVVSECIAFLQETGLTTEGMFRVPGNQLNVDLIRQRYDKGEKGVISDPKHPARVHDVCTLLKLWMRELPEPVIPTNYYEKLMSLVRSDLKGEDPKTTLHVIAFVDDLPTIHQQLLGTLVSFLDDVSQKKDENKMSAANLATCFAPSLMRAPEGTEINVILQDMQAAITAVRIFILNADQLATSNTKNTNTKNVNYEANKSLVNVDINTQRLSTAV